MFMILDANSMSSIRVGWSTRDAQSVIGKYIHEIFDGVRENGLVARCNEVLDGGEAVHLSEFEFQDSQARTSVFNVDLCPLSDDSILITYTNVTEQIKTEDALRESEGRFRSLYNETPVMMHSIDSDRRIVSVSNYWLKMLGYERDEVIGESVLNFLTGSPKPEAEEILSGEFESIRIVEDMPLEFKKKDGGTLEVLLSALHEYDEDGNVLNRRAVLIDITERRRLEGAILEISEREQRRLGQDIHDDVLQTLHGVWLMSEKLRDELSAKHAEATDTLQRISNLVNNSLEKLRSLVRGLHVVEWSPNEFGHVLTDLVNDVERTHQSDGVLCSVYVDDGIVMPDVRTATHLIRITQEAIANAIKHGAATEIIVRVIRENGVMELTVRDNGDGIVLPLPEAEGFGLRIMDYRTRLIKGILKVGRLKDGGTIVTCTCPLPG